MGVPYLPRLKDNIDNGLLLPARVGIWDDGQQDARVGILASALAMQDPGQTPGAVAAGPEVHSIPDPWSRILLFARALYDNAHPMHARIAGEWRGLLALFGLRHIRRFDALAVKLVDLTGAEQQGRASFSRVLARLRPDLEEARMNRRNLTLIDPASTFQRFYLLKVQQKPRGQQPAKVFGMTSPTTLVATGAFYEGLFDRQEVPWFDGKRLTDPARFLNQHEKTALAEWVNQLKAGISGMNQNPNRRSLLLLELLGKYAQDLDPQAAVMPGLEILSNSSPLPLTEGISRHLSRAHRGEHDVVTELEIISKDKGATGYVLIDPQVVTHMSEVNAPLRTLNEIVVYGNYSLEAAKSLPTAKKTSGSFDGDKMRWCSPDFFFQDTLLYEKTEDDDADIGESAFPRCYEAKKGEQSSPPDNQKREIVFPLTEDAVKLFSIDELVKNFTVTWHFDGSAVCHLSFTVRKTEKGEKGESLPGQERTVTIEKQYAREDTTHLRSIPPVCIWPDFRFRDEDDKGTNRWQRYFLFESWHGIADTEIFAASPLDQDADEQRMITLDNDYRFKVQPMTRFPEVLVCTMPFGNKPRAGSDKPPQGLLLIKAPDLRVPGPGHSAVIGIDFGTTGTSVYRSIDGGNGPNAATRITFTNRLFPVTSGGDSNYFRRLTRQLFIPGGAGDDGAVDSGRILSIYQLFPRDGKERFNVDAEIPVRDGHVLFPATGDASGFFVGPDGSIHSNMKWGSEQENAAAQGFLTQICMEALAELVMEGVNDVRIRYSYPTAFSERDQTRWNGNWKAVIENLHAVTSLPVDLYQNDRLCREAVAATRYFAANRGLAIQQGAVTLDIGGGTTDVAVWHKDSDNRPSLMAHLSVLFAGRDIFLKPLSQKPEILTRLSSNVPIEKLVSAYAARGDAYWGLLNAIVAAHGDAMIVGISKKEGVPMISEFLKILEIGLCGIGFYTGLLVGKLIKDGSYGAADTIPVFVGGNGSKLFKWCGLGDFKAPTSSNQGTAFYKSFAKSFLAGAQVGVPGLNADIEVYLSNHPKEEVAAGLVAPGMDIKIEDRFTEPMAGEAFSINNNGHMDQEWSEPLTAADVAGLKVEIDTTLPIFSKFLASLDHSYLQISYSERDIEKFGGQIQNKLGEIAHAIKEEDPKHPDRTAAASSLRRSPIFFEALDALLDNRVEGLVKL